MAKPVTTTSSFSATVFWKDRFVGDPAIVGKSILLNGKPQTVVASRPRISIGSSRMARSPAQSPALLVALSCFRNRFTITSRWPFPDRGRALEAGVTPAQAQAEMTAIAAQLEHEYPDFDGHWGVNVVPLRPANYPANSVPLC